MVLLGFGIAASFSWDDGVVDSGAFDCGQATSRAGLELRLRTYRPVAERRHNIANSNLNGASMVAGKGERLETTKTKEKEGRDESSCSSPGNGGLR